MIHSIHFWYRSLLYLLLLYAIFSIAWWTITFIVLKLGRVKNLTRMVEFIEQKMRPQSMIARFTCLAFGFIGGLGFQDVHSYRKIDTLHDITIIDKRSGHIYDYVFKDSDAVYTTKMCDNFDPDFPMGSSLEFIKFRNDIKCWDVSDSKTGYKYNRDKVVKNNGTRQNSNP